MHGHKKSVFSLPKLLTPLRIPGSRGLKVKVFSLLQHRLGDATLPPSPPGFPFNFAMGLVMEDGTAGP